MKKIALFGAGQIGATILKKLTADQVVVDFFVDNKKQGEFCGLPVIKPDQAQLQCEGIYITTLEYYDEIEAQLKALGLNILGCKTNLAEMIASHFCTHNPVSVSFDMDAAVSHLCHLAIDLIDACQLRCTACYRGVGMIKNTEAKMSLETFASICRKLGHHNFKRIALYNWTEPFLNTNLQDYVKLFRQILGDDIFLGLCSNLSLKKIPALEPTLSAGVNEFLVTVSGFSQKIHGIYHRGSEIEVVKGHLEKISFLAQDKGINIVIKYLNFGYNKKEIPRFEKYARDLGFAFQTVAGFGFPLEPNDLSTLTYHDTKLKEDLYGKWDITQFMDGIGKLCNSQFYIDCHADVYLCCRYPNQEQFHIGNFQKDSLTELMTRRQLHPYCTRCNVKMS